MLHLDLKTIEYKHQEDMRYAEKERLIREVMPRNPRRLHRAEVALSWLAGLVAVAWLVN